MRSIDERLSVSLRAVRIKLGPDQPAPQPDPLGRDRIGYLQGLDPFELWERGRGVWKAQLPKVAEADLLVLVHAGIVVGVGSIDGARFIEDRVAITGRPALAEHPLIGQPDPLPNLSRNPIAYGTVTTVPVTPDISAQRSFDAVLQDAVDVLTEAARRRVFWSWPLEGQPDSPSLRSAPADWAEFVTLALAGAAANIGGIDDILAGRSGSWEAAGVRSLLLSTVGDDPAALWRHRTDPIVVPVNVDGMLLDRADEYDAAEDALSEERSAIEEAEWAVADAEEIFWHYDIPDGATIPIPREPDAPAWSWDAFREAGRAYGMSNADSDLHAAYLQKDLSGIIELTLPRTAAAAARIEEITAQIAARSAPVEERIRQLNAQQTAEREEFIRTVTAAVHAAADAIPGLTASVSVDLDPEDPYGDDVDELTRHLLDAAIAAAPIPHTGLFWLRPVDDGDGPSSDGSGS